MATQAGVQSDCSIDEPIGAISLADLPARFRAARDAQERWSRSTVKDRLRVIRKIRHQIVERAGQIATSVTYPQRNGPAETLAAELIPLADACKFLENEAATVLAPRRLSRSSRPRWLSGVSVELRRDPFGIVLIIGASNYPLFLPGVQSLQALVAGNAVFIKPGIGATETARSLAETFVIAGLDPALVNVLPEDLQSVTATIEAGANKVILTGSADTGRRVLSLLSQRLTPATMELSGCDCVFVLDSADLDRVVRCLAFGSRFNSGATCIAPRRVFVSHTMKAELEQRLRGLRSQSDSESEGSFSNVTVQLIADAIRSGARVIVGSVVEDNGSTKLRAPIILSDATPEMHLLQSDVFAPVMSLVPVGSTDEALCANGVCPYALGAAVFGEGQQARAVAERIDAGCVVINDMIAPTADPRASFGGRRQSGFGVTRGAAGLEELTQLKTMIHQRGSWLPHLEEPTPYDAELLSNLLGMTHGSGWRRRFRNAWSVARAAIDRRNWKKERNIDRRPGDVQ